MSVAAEPLWKYGARRFDAAKGQWLPIATAANFSGVSWSFDGKYLFAQNILEPGQPVYRFRGGFRRERVASFEELLTSGAEGCLLNGLAPDGSLVIAKKHGNGQVQALDLDLP